jgi:enamine deaminase RidA (YjgF/YER057c/UK114 family)
MGRSLGADGIEFISTPALPDVLDYAAASAVDPTCRVVFTAGACPLAPDGSTVAPGDVVAQAHQVVENLRIGGWQPGSLRAGGAGK